MYIYFYGLKKNKIYSTKAIKSKIISHYTQQQYNLLNQQMYRSAIIFIVNFYLFYFFCANCALHRDSFLMFIIRIYFNFNPLFILLFLNVFIIVVF